VPADLVAFLRARQDEDEAGARDAFGDHNDDGPEWTEVSSGALSTGAELHGIGDSAISRHMVRWDPARVLAEIDAKRRIIEQHHRSGVTCPRCSLGTEDGEVVFERDPCGTLRLLALPYAGHPDYRAEWAPHVEVARVRWLP
jgi:hypothetical protein